MNKFTIFRWTCCLLALCLCFSIPSFPVFAENSEEVSDEDLIIPPSNPEDVPLIEDAITTFSRSISRTVYYPDGQNLSDYLGISRQNVIDVLAPHINDTFFLGTPYVSGDHCNPNGDPAGYGSKDSIGVPAMNCTGFVWYVLHAAGSNKVPGRNGWVSLLTDNQITYITYVDHTGENRQALKEAVAADAEPGDIIWAWEGAESDLKNGLSYKLSSSHHIGIYIGDAFRTQLDPSNPTGKWNCTGSLSWWHSTNASYGEALSSPGNIVTEIAPKASNCISYTLIKLGGSLHGELTLSKSSTYPYISQDNPNYSLEGAVYGVFSDSECTQKAGELLTDSSGNTNTLTLKEGDYWIKELSAPAGFELNTQISSVSVKYGDTTVCQVKDTPHYIPVNILFQKVDFETKKALSGAEFTVKYYADLYETDPEQLGITPDRIWHFQTDEEGFCYLKDPDTANSDGLFFADDEAVLPLGTITIQETKAPEGYLLNEDILVYPFTQTTSEFQYPRIENQRIPEVPVPEDPIPEEPEPPFFEPVEPPPEKPVHNSVKTGDTGTIGFYLTLLFISLGTMLYFSRKQLWN